MTRPLRPVVIWVLVALVGGCVTPATGVDSYRGKASKSIEAAISEVEAAHITVQALLDERLFAPYADEVISANESSLGSVSDAFGSVQPPAGTDQLRTDVTALLADAEDAVSTARIATRRRDRPALTVALGDIAEVSAQLQNAETELR